MFGVTVRLMSDGELSRLEVLRDLDHRRLTAAAAAQLQCIEEVGIEEVFGWSKATAGFRKTRRCGLARVNWMFTLTITAYNLVRLPRLMAVVT